MKILIVRFSSIGDIVLTTPVIRCIKQQLNAEVHFLTKPNFKPILETNPYIDKLHILDKSVYAKAKELRAQNFDYVIDLHNNIRTLIFKKTIDVEAWSFPKLNFEKWLLVNLKVNKMPDIHIVDRYFEPASQLGVVNDNKGLDYFLPSNFEWDYPVDVKENYIAWAIGAQHFTKQFPVSKIINICNQINKPIYLLGGKEDISNAESIIAATGSHVKSLCGKLSLHQSAYMVKESNFLITNDTGLMHIGAAYQKPIISLWGNTTPLLGMYPYYGNSNVKQTIIENNNLNCRPCSKIGYHQCPKKHFKCMIDLDEATIIKTINGYIAN
ncbi:MAG: glycosyltransferase family 9 protein [Bacteroidota bacterium]